MCLLKKPQTCSFMHMFQISTLLAYTLNCKQTELCPMANIFINLICPVFECVRLGSTKAKRQWTYADLEMLLLNDRIALVLEHCSRSGFFSDQCCGSVEYMDIYDIEVILKKTFFMFQNLNENKYKKIVTSQLPFKVFCYQHANNLLDSLVLEEAVLTKLISWQQQCLIFTFVFEKFSYFHMLTC